MDTSKEQAGNTEGDRSFSHVCDVSCIVNEQLLGRCRTETNHITGDRTTYVRYQWRASSTMGGGKAHAGSPKREKKREHRLRAGIHQPRTPAAKPVGMEAICTHGTFHCAAPCMRGCRRLVTRCKPGLQPPDVVVAAPKVWMHAYSASPSFLARQLTIWSDVNMHNKSHVCFEGCVADSRC